MVDTLATKYVEARKGLDERIEELQAENKGLVDKAIGAIKADHQHDPRARRDAQERARPGGRRRRRDHQAPGRVPRQPDRRHQGRHPQVQGQHPRPPAQGPDGLAVRRARRGWRRAAGDVRPQGHHQAARVDLRPDLDATSATASSSRSARRRWPRSRRASTSSRSSPARASAGSVGDAAGEARRHQGDDPRAGEGLRRHEDHHRRHHLADRPAQPGGGVHQGLQADLRRRDVLRGQRQPDREVRQHRHRLRGRHRPRQRRRRRRPRSRTCWARWCRSSSASWPA